MNIYKCLSYGKKYTPAFSKALKVVLFLFFFWENAFFELKMVDKFILYSSYDKKSCKFGFRCNVQYVNSII